MAERSTLYVEGLNDAHVIWHLLRRHGIECPFGNLAEEAIPPAAPEIRVAGDLDKLLDAIKDAVRFSGGPPVGFVPDADESPGNRWQAVRDRLSSLSVDAPREVPRTGFVADVPNFLVRVGVWLMPDNTSPGALEDFLKDLVNDEDPLLPFAHEATDTARSHGARFSDSNREKAVVHAWLAWQQSPGLRYGEAIRARYFGADSGAAETFRHWFANVFGVARPDGVEP